MSYKYITRIVNSIVSVGLQNETKKVELEINFPWFCCDACGTKTYSEYEHIFRTISEKILLFICFQTKDYMKAKYNYKPSVHSIIL